MKLANIYPCFGAAVALLYVSLNSPSVIAEAESEQVDMYNVVDIPSREKRNVISIHVTEMSLSNPDQEFGKVVGNGCLLWILCGDYTNPVAIKFDSSPATVVSLEYEHLNSTGWYSLGLELFQLDRSYTAEGLVETRGKLETTNLLFNGKIYLNSDGVIQPYVGLGLGTAQSKLSGAVSGNVRGSVWKTVLGINYRLENVSLRAGYQRSEIGVTTSDARGNDGQDREIKAESFLDFDGYFAGLSILF